MANTISIHPAVDKGTKPAAANFAGGTLVCHCSDKKVAVAIGSQCAPQPCLRLHKMLEAGRRAVLPDRGRAARQSPRDCEWRQISNRRSQRGHQTSRLQKLRRAHVCTHRERQASFVRFRFHPHRIVVASKAGHRPNSLRLFPQSSNPAPIRQTWARSERDSRN